ncbi:hypothetical protein SAMN04487914_13716 [Arthrobacter sp. ok909]|uniref:hypothetical protein n=1 Tax=Arthrobacter sp. ok909 TaxID=1761746 RepID=UPI00088E8094|nr:hypothetical protein [Arthrobacter sp. ok909]SDP77221.1 hypothetical protein SAMN04487914_13716 [Arthrobacter sp. ok909]
MSQPGHAGKLERAGCYHHASGVDGTVSEECVEAVTRAVFSEDTDFSVLAHGSPLCCRTLLIASPAWPAPDDNDVVMLPHGQLPGEW